MIEREDTNINVDEIMVKIREEITKREEIDPIKLSFDWNQIESDMDAASQNVLAGTKEFDMLRFPIPIRWFAKFAAKLIQYVARVITFHQNNFNQSIFNSILLLLPGLNKNEIDLAELKNQIIELREKSIYLNTSITMQERRFATLLEETKNHITDPIRNEKLEKITNEKEHLLDLLYNKFENKFRGTREEIKQKLKVYLPLVRDVPLGAQSCSILDIGCGRGEWLELLKEQKIDAIGVDLNYTLKDLYGELGLKIVNMDVFDYLKGLSDSSLRAVTAFHLIEHIRYPEMIRLFDEVLRVMKPGGIAIYETPNPENIFVGACSFYNDPSHLNPIPPRTAKFFLESRGYHNVTVMPLNPNSEAKIDITNDNENSEIIKRFNAYFYGPQDYALIGYKI